MSRLFATSKALSDVAARMTCVLIAGLLVSVAAAQSTPNELDRALDEFLDAAIGDDLATPPPGNPCVVSTMSIACGETVNGVLEAGDDTLPGPILLDVYEFQLVTPSIVTITLTSTDFDPFLTLRDQNCDAITSNDNCATNPATTSCLEPFLSPGTYYIYARSASPNEAGNYELSVTCATPCSAGGPYDVQCQGPTTDVQLEGFGGSLTLAAGAHTLDTDTGLIDGAPWPGFDGVVFSFLSLTIENGATLRATGTQPLIIVSLQDVTIDGVLDISGEDGVDGATSPILGTGGAGGPGGFDGGDAGGFGTQIGNPGAGPGGAGGGTGFTFGPGRAGGGGGGGHIAMGTAGTGNLPFAPGGAGGLPYLSLPPLIGGSGGGAGGAGAGLFSAGGGGGGGGAAQVVSLTGTVTVAVGGIDASGGNGGISQDLDQGGGGGGSGGSIEILSAVAPSVPGGALIVNRGFGGFLAPPFSSGGNGADGNTNVAMITPQPLGFLWMTDCPGGTFDDATLPNPVLTIDTAFAAPDCAIDCMVELTITVDPTGNPVQTSCSADVSISDTTAPIICCPPDRTVECDLGTAPGSPLPPVLYSVSPTDGDDFLRVIDAASGSTISMVPITLAGETVRRAHGLATQPITGKLWAIVTLNTPQSNGRLVTIEPETGVATLVGDTGDRFAGMAFADDGTLYAVTGDGGANPESLFTLSTADATATFVMALGNGDAGETIAYNPDDGLIYHMSGTSAASKVLEKIDPIAMTVTNVPLSGDDYLAALSLTWDPARSAFLMTDLAQRYFTVTPGGVVTLIGFMDHLAKGLTFTADIGMAVASDDCTADPAIAFADVITPGACPQEMTITRTWTATDDCGNVADCVQVIEVVDTTNPVIACPADVTIECTASTLPANTGSATASDNCSVTDAGVLGPVTYFPAGLGSVSVTTGHFDGDANIDLALANANGDDVSILLGDGVGGFGAPTSFLVGDNPVSVTTGHFNGDANLDLAVANRNDDNVSILLGDGAGGFTGPTNFSVGDMAESVTGGHFNGDGFLDLAVANAGVLGNDVSILLGDGLGGFGAATSFAVGLSPRSVTTGLFNADANLDLAVANSSSDNVSILLGDGLGGFGAATNFAAGDAPESVTTGHFDADGNLDLAVANRSDDDVSILLGDGLGGFGGPTDFPVGDGPVSVTAGDLDGDGVLDLAVANASSFLVSTLLGDGLGGFGAPTDSAPIGNVFSVATGHFNGDANLDLAVAIGNGFASILLNQTTFTGTVTSDDVITGTACPEEFTIARTWTATDECGNTSQCVQTITVEDSTMPMITCPADMTIECTDSTAPADTGMATATDNCDMVGPVIAHTDVVTMGPPPCPQLATIVRTWTATDCAGNVDTCMQTIVVQDTSVPQIFCPADVTIECDMSTAPTAAGTGVATANTDNCTGLAPTITSSDTVTPAGTCPQEMTITRTWTADYACSPDAMCVQTITVVDTTDPAMLVPADIRIPCDVDPLNTAVTGMATATDNCSTPVPTFTDAAVPGPEMTTIITRTWTVTDGCNISAGNQEIIQFPCQADRASGTEKGTAAVASDLTLRWDAAGNPVQDVFISLTNDWITDVQVKLYFVNGDPPLQAVPPPPFGPATPERAHPGWNFVDQAITLTHNQASYWSLLTGQPGPGNAPLVPLTILDPAGDPTMAGRPALDGTGDRVLRGLAFAWAINADGDLIKLNHLTGTVTVVNYRDGAAWQYDLWTFQAVGLFFQGEVIGPGGVLNFDGMQFARPYDQLLLDFYAAGSSAFSGGAPFQLVDVDTVLTLHPLSADLRQENHGPVTTKATFTVWNENETQFTGLHRCITCWDSTLLSLYADATNHFLATNLQTDKGKARIDGLTSELCSSNCCIARANGGCEDADCQELVCQVRAECCTMGWDEECVWIAVDLCEACDGVNGDAALLGVATKLLRFGGLPTAAAALNLTGMGQQDAQIRYDVAGGGGGPPPVVDGDGDEWDVERDWGRELDEER